MMMQSKPDRIFDQVNDLKKWPQWIPWLKNDNTTKIRYCDIWVGNEGCYYWQTEKGTGKVTIVKSNAFSVIETLTEFEGTPPVFSRWRFEETLEGTKVTWTMETNLPFPENLLGPVINAVANADFEKGLNNIKQIAQTSTNVAP